MTVTITLNGLGRNPPATITSRDFTKEHEIAFLDKNRVAVEARAHGQGFNLGKPQVTERLQGKTVMYYVKEGSARETINLMRTVIAEVFDKLGKSLELIPSSSVEFFLNPGSSDSVGYCYRDRDGDRTAVFLGATAVKQKSKIDNFMSDTVADRYFGGNIKEHIRAIVLHELGHVFHQCLSLSHYMTLGRVAILGRDGASPAGEVLRIWASLLTTSGQAEEPVLGLPREGTSADTLNRFITNSRALGKDLSYYAHMNGMNEFVAEMFSALNMSLPIDSPLTALPGPFPTGEEVMAAYRQLGGPEVSMVGRAPEAPSSARAGVLVPATSYPGRAATAAATESKTGLGKG